MTRPKAPLVLSLCACACITSSPPPQREQVQVAPAPRVRRRRVILRAPGVRGLVEEFRVLRDLPEAQREVPEAARAPLRALRAGLKTWLLDAVRAAGRVPPRVELRAILNEAELTRARAGEEIQWGTVTRIDVTSPGASLTAVVIGLRLGCTSDDALYVFDGERLVLELAQDAWERITDARADLRVTRSQAARNQGALMVSSRSASCGARFQFVRFEGVTPGQAPDRPTVRWNLRHGVDITGECGGFDEATLGISLSRNGFELTGCEVEGDSSRATRARYAFTHEGVEREEGATFRRSHRR